MEIDTTESKNDFTPDKSVEQDPPISSWLSKPKLRSGYLTYMSLRTVIIIPWKPDIIKQAVVASWLGECRSYTIKRISTGVSAAELIFASTDIGDVAFLDLKQHLEGVGVEVTHPNVYQQHIQLMVRRGTEFRYRNEFDEVVGVSHGKEFFTRMVIVESLPPHLNNEDSLCALFPEADTVLSYEFDVNAKGIAVLVFENVPAAIDFLETKGPKMILEDGVKVELYRYAERTKDYHKHQSYINKTEKAQLNTERTLEDYERLQLNAGMNELRKEFEVIHNKCDILGSAKLCRIQEIEKKTNLLMAMIKYDTGRRLKHKLSFPELDEEMQAFTKHALGKSEEGQKEGPNSKAKEETDQLKSLKEMEKQLKTLEREYNSINSKIHEMDHFLTPEQKIERQVTFGKSIIDLEPEEFKKKLSNDNLTEVTEALNFETNKLYKQLKDLKQTQARLKNIQSTTKLGAVAEEKMKRAAVPSLMTLKVPGTEDVKHAMDISMEELDYKTLYIGEYIHTPTIQKDLEKVFSRAISINAKQSQRKGRGYAFAWYKTEEECKIDLELHQGAMLNGTPLTVSYKKKDKNAETAVVPEPELDYKSLYIGGFKYTPTIQKDLQELFRRANSIHTVQKEKGQSFAFAWYKTEEECKLDCDLHQGAILNGAPLKVDYRIPNKIKEAAVAVKPEHLIGRDRKALVVKGFRRGDPRTIEKQLMHLCRHSSQIKMVEKSGPMFAVVLYKSAEACQLDHDQLQGKHLEGFPLTVSFKMKTRKYKMNSIESKGHTARSIPVVSSPSKDKRNIPGQRAQDYNIPVQQFNIPTLLGQSSSIQEKHNQYGIMHEHNQQYNVPEQHRQPYSISDQQNQMQAPFQMHSQQFNMPGYLGQELHMPDRNYPPGGDQDTQSVNDVQKLFKGISEVLASKITELESRGGDNMSGNLSQLGDEILQRIGQNVQGGMSAPMDQFRQQVNTAIDHAYDDSVHSSRNQRPY